MSQKNTSVDSDIGQTLSWAVALLDVPAFAVASAAVGFVLCFLVTGVILIQSPTPGAVVGGELRGLSHFLPGYDVSAWGSVVGAVYGGVVGLVVGGMIALAWNFSHAVVTHVLTLRELLFRV